MTTRRSSSNATRRSCSGTTSSSREVLRDELASSLASSPGSLRDASRGPRRDSSAPAMGDASPAAARDASSAGVSDELCSWCRRELEATAPAFQRFCSKRCRQSAWRLRCQVATSSSYARPMRLGYADPPYPAKARLYKDQASYAGEVDHRALIASLVDGYDGWALSTSAAALQDVLELCPRGVHVAPWVKPRGVSSKGKGMQNA